MFPHAGFSQWDTCRSHERTLRIYTINDYFNGGWAVYTDDYRSFGFAAQYLSRTNWEFGTEFFGLTNREGAPQGGGKRSDHFELSIGKRFGYIEGYSRLEFLPFAGGFCGGDIGLQMIQNRWRRVLNIPELSMTYDSKAFATLLAGGESSIRSPTTFLAMSNLP